MKTQIKMLKDQSAIAEQMYWEQVNLLIDLEAKTTSDRRLAYQNSRVQKRFYAWFDFDEEIRALEA